jgi:hypothetical protein
VQLVNSYEHQQLLSDYIIQQAFSVLPKQKGNRGLLDSMSRTKLRNMPYSGKLEFPFLSEKNTMFLLLSLGTIHSLTHATFLGLTTDVRFGKGRKQAED